MYKGLYIAVVPYSVFANPSRSTPRISSLSTTEANDNGCGGCHLVTEKVYASVDSPHSAGFGGAILTSPTSYIVFTAYSLTSTYISRDLCIASSGDSSSVGPAFSFAEPTSIGKSKVLASAESAFTSYIGYPSCAGSRLAIPTTGSLASVSNSSSPISAASRRLSTSSAIRTSSPSLPISSTESLPTRASQSRLAPQARIGIEIGIPVSIVALTVIANFECLRYRTRKFKDETKTDEPMSENDQFYLQRKGELEAGERSKNELPAEDRRNELEENEMKEMSTTVDGDLSFLRRQELNGEEFAGELE